eukprot:scaffold5824_cov373-Prasinococcus_capsulatus_cf.AAC.1
MLTEAAYLYPGLSQRHTPASGGTRRADGDMREGLIRHSLRQLVGGTSLASWRGPTFARPNEAATRQLGPAMREACMCGRTPGVSTVAAHASSGRGSRVLGAAVRAVPRGTCKPALAGV